MIDTINPMSLDLTKNLHGHVRVELRDRWTGRVVDSREKDNLVTNAVQKLMLTAMWSNAGGSKDWIPLYSRPLGGLFLFDGTLTESADNISFPPSAKLVAYAGQIGNTSEAIGGSFNGEESVPTANGFTTVWDFATSQANGTIASLARSSYAFSVFPAGILTGNELYSFVSGDLLPTGFAVSNFTYLGYDDTNKYIYFTLNSTVSVGGVSYSSATIYRAKANLSALGVFFGFADTSTWEVVKTLTSSDGSTNARWYTYDQYAQNFVWKSGQTLHIVALDGTHTTKTLSGSTDPYKLAVTENYYWTTNTAGDTVYRYDKTNTANVQAITANCTYLAPGDNDIMFGWNSAIVSIIYPDKSVVNKSKVTTTGFPALSFRKIGPFYSWSSGVGSSTAAHQLYPTSHYLGTIANLDNPVTKASSQTMKVTYTLTEA